MTDTQHKIFREILDLNWDMKQETNPTKKLELLGKLTQKKIDLKKDMGEVEYNRFMDAGAKMFAPKKD
jgi:hypothetical protein